MAIDSRGLHHFHRRKRVHQKHEPYPHPNKFKRFMDKAIFVIGVLGPLLTVPQVTKIWLEKNASGVSIISWAAYLFYAVFWLIYGFLHKERPIIVTYLSWIVLDLFIVVGIIIYG